MLGFLLHGFLSFFPCDFMAMRMMFLLLLSTQFILLQIFVGDMFDRFIDEPYILRGFSDTVDDRVVALRWWWCWLRFLRLRRRLLEGSGGVQLHSGGDGEWKCVATSVADR